MNLIFPSWPRSIFWPAVLPLLILVAACSSDDGAAISAPGAATPGTPLPTGTVVEPLISMSGELDLSDLPDDFTELMFAMLDESGGEWRPVDNALTSLDGPVRSLPQVASRDIYSFSWGAFYPHMGIYSP